MNWTHRMLVFAGALLVPSLAQAAPPNVDECLAANDKAQDLRREGKLHDAREKLVVCIATSCPGPVREDCAQRITEIDTATPSLIFEVKDSQGHDLSTVKVKVDDLPFVDHLDGSALPVDPGEHRIVVEAEGVAHSETLVVHEGDKSRHVPVVLGAIVVEGRGQPSTDPAIGPSSTSSSLWAKRPAVVAFSVGGTGLLLGSLFTGLALHEKSQADAACGSSHNQCSGNADSFNSAIRTDTGLAVAGFSLAAAGTLVGVLLLPHDRSITPVIGFGYAGLAGRF